MAVPSVAPVVGFFGPPSSNINWCETGTLRYAPLLVLCETQDLIRLHHRTSVSSPPPLPDYAISHFVAEWWNTLSNMPPLLLGVIGYMVAGRLFRERRSGVVQTVQPRAARLGYFILIIVFAGSALFHMTLTYLGQLLDELPMILGACYLHYLLHPKPSTPFAFFLLSLAAFITYLMAAMRDSPLPLQLCYSGVVLGLVVRCVLIRRAEPMLRDLRLLERGVFIYHLGAAAWLLDQNFCTQLRFLHLHAWWHLLAGVGVYFTIQFASANRMRCDDKLAGHVPSLVLVAPLAVARAFPIVVPAECVRICADTGRVTVGFADQNELLLSEIRVDAGGKSS